MGEPQVSFARPIAKKIEFVKVKDEAPNRLILNIEGPPKEGKTSFCLTAPGPIAFHNFDLGLEGVVGPFSRTKDIYEFQYTIPISARLPGSGFAALAEPAAKVWEQFVLNFRASLEEMRTVVVDTGSEAWNLCRLARLGKLTQIMPIQYTAVNAEFRQLTQLALVQQKANVIYTHKVKWVYKNEQKTEETERAGFGEIGYDVQANLRTHRDYSKTGAEQFNLRIEECRPNIMATGKELRGDDITFSKVACLMYSDIPEEFWLK